MKNRILKHFNEWAFSWFGKDFPDEIGDNTNMIQFAQYCVEMEKKVPDNDPQEVKLLLKPTGSIVIFKEPVVPVKGDVVRYKGREFEVKSREFVIDGNFVRVICQMKGAKNNSKNKF